MIRNKAVINEDASGNVLQLQAEIKRLRNMLDHFKCESFDIVFISGIWPGEIIHRYTRNRSA